jgi:hypothetical protein
MYKSPITRGELAAIFRLLATAVERGIEEDYLLGLTHALAAAHPCREIDYPDEDPGAWDDRRRGDLNG